MYHPNFIARFQWMVILGGFILTLAYWLFYQPLATQVNQYDRLLQDRWDNLAAINLKYKIKLGMDSTTVGDNEMLAGKAVIAMQRAARQIKERIELDPEARDQLRQPIQLLDFDQKRFQLIFDLQRLAEEKKVTLQPPVISGFPDYVPGRDKPALVWAQLVLFDATLASAVSAEPTAIKTVQLLPVRMHVPKYGEKNPLCEFPLRMELSGSMEAIVNFLRCLPLKTDELAAAHLPVPPVYKPAQFIEKLILKSIAGNPNEVNLEVLVNSLLPLEISP